MYKEIFVRSLNDLKNNVVLFLPDILFGVFMLIIGGTIVYFSGLLPILDVVSENIMALTQGTISDKEQALAILMNLWSLNFKKLIIAFASFMITNFFVGAGFMCLKYGMMRNVVKNRKIRFKEVYKLSRKFYWKYILLKIFTRLFYLIPFLIVALISTLMLFKGGILSNSLVGVLFLAYLIYSVLLLFVFYFTIPILFIKDLKPMEVIKESYNFLRLKTKYVLTIWLIVLMVIVGSLFLKQVLSLFSNILFLAFVINIFSSLVSFVINVWKDMFKFRAYK